MFPRSYLKNLVYKEVNKPIFLFKSSTSALLILLNIKFRNIFLIFFPCVKYSHYKADSKIST